MNVRASHGEKDWVRGVRRQPRAAASMYLRWLAAVVAVLLLPAAAMAQAWSVGPGGNFEDLGWALFLVPTGDAIDVLEGDYEGNFERSGSLTLKIGTQSKARIVGDSVLKPVLHMTGEEFTVVVEAQGEIVATGTAGTGEEVQAYGLHAEGKTINVTNEGEIVADVSGLKDLWVYGMFLEGENEVTATNHGLISVKATLPEDAGHGRKRVVGLAALGTDPLTQVEVMNSGNIEVELD